MVVPAPPPLLRLSQLARFWEKNPRTIMGWIRQGRLAAIRSPGNHYRVRIADVRAFCEREGMPVPPFVAPPARRVVVAATAGTTVRAVVRALRLPGMAVEAPEDPYEALLVAASESTALLVMGTAGERFDASAAIAALRRLPSTSSLPILAVGAATRARAASLEKAGATRVLLRGQADDLPRVVRELLALD